MARPSKSPSRNARMMNSQSLFSDTAYPASFANRVAQGIRSHAVPLVAIAVLTVLSGFNVGVIPHSDGQSPLEWANHHIGHELNSIWVGVSLLALFIPAVVARFKGKRDRWIW